MNMKCIQSNDGGMVMQNGYLKTTDKAYIYYEDVGQGEDTLLFVPGHMCTTKFFRKNAAFFAKDHRVVLMDSRGFGNSSKPLHGNDIERHADDIKELIDFLDLKQVILVGWSLSGSVVTTYTAKYHGYRMKALGLLDACLFPFSPASWNSYNSRDYNMDDWNQKYRLWYTEPERYIENFVNRVKVGLSDTETEMVRCEIGKTPPWIGFALHTDWCHTDCVKLLPEISVPVIIFSGESKGHSASMGNYYETQITTYCEHHKFTEGGHMLFFIEADRFNGLLEAFIQKVS